MSGSTIGGVVGAFVGYFFGAPQLGWAIGSAIGGYVDPEKVKQFGPRLTDAMQQTARDGVAIPFGYGTFPCAGNIIWTTGVTEVAHVEKSDGKGSGVETTTTTYSYHRSYAIGVCEGPVGKFLVIKRNGVPVYDTSSDAQLTALGYTSSQIASVRSATSAFLQKATLYLGSETQLPDSTIEAVEGAGNVSAFRGLAYIVVENDDLTDFRGAIPQYEFVVATCGAVTSSYVEPGAWVADADAAAVHQIGPTDGEQTTYTVAGTDKFGIGMSPDSRYVWVLNSTNGSAPYSISKVSTVDGDVSLTFPVTGTPRQLIPSPDGDFLYVGDGSDNSVVKYGTDGGGEVDRTTNLGTDPYSLAISADGSEVYAGTLGSGIKRIDASDMSVTATIGAGTEIISGLAVSPTDADKLYATVSLTSGFIAVDLSDNSYAVKTGPTLPAGLCFSTDGAKAYFVCSAGQVAVVTAATDTWTHNFDVGADFEAIATNLNGDKLFVGTSSFGADLRQVDIATEAVTEIYASVRVYQRRGITARPLP